MSEEKVKTRKHVRHQERLSLNPDALERVNRWLSQVTSSQRGVALSRKDLVNWMLNAREAELTPTEVAALSQRYFCKKRFLRAALKEVEQSGDLDFKTLLQSAELAPPKAIRPRKKKLPESGDGGASEQLITSESL